VVGYNSVLGKEVGANPTNRARAGVNPFPLVRRPSRSMSASFNGACAISIMSTARDIRAIETAESSEQKKDPRVERPGSQSPGVVNPLAVLNCAQHVRCSWATIGQGITGGLIRGIAPRWWLRGFLLQFVNPLL
jgi:hypothetical protein